MKIFGAWIVALAVLLAVSGNAQAQQATVCGCTWWYSGAAGSTSSVELAFTTTGSCATDSCETRDCKDSAGPLPKGQLAVCRAIAPTFQGSLPPKVPPGAVEPPIASIQPITR